MKFFNSKFVNILLVAVCLMLFITNKCSAESNKLQITSIGPVIKDNNGFIQNISVNFNPKSNWTLSVLALDSYVQNNTNSSKSLPVNRIRIIDSETSNEYLLEKGKSVIIKSGTEKGRLDKRFQIRLLAGDGDYPGNYSTAIQFDLKLLSKSPTEVFNVSFEQGDIQNINILPVSLNHRVSSDNLLKKGQIIRLNQPTKIVIRSNSEWKLILNGDFDDDEIQQEFKVISLPQGCTSSYTNDFYEVGESSKVIVRGNPTVGSNNNIEARTVQLEYRFITPEDEIVPSDFYPFNLEYRLVPNN